MTVTPPSERARRRASSQRAPARDPRRSLAVAIAAAARRLRRRRRGTDAHAAPRRPTSRRATTVFTLVAGRQRHRPAGRAARGLGRRFRTAPTCRHRAGHRHARARRVAARRPRRARPTGSPATTAGVATRRMSATGAIDAVSPGGDQQIERASASPPPTRRCRTARPGVYPLVATYQGADGPVASHERDDRAGRRRRGGRDRRRRADHRGRPVGGAPHRRASSPSSPPRPARSPTQLNAVEGTAAILAVDPAIPAAIRVLGTSAPASRAGVARPARRPPADPVRRCSSAMPMSRSSSRPGCRARCSRRRCSAT